MPQVQFIIRRAGPHSGAMGHTLVISAKSGVLVTCTEIWLAHIPTLQGLISTSGTLNLSQFELRPLDAFDKVRRCV